MKVSELIQTLRRCVGECDNDPQVDFVGIKWQEQHHPSAELFPIEFMDAKATTSRKVTLKFITTKHNQ